MKIVTLACLLLISVPCFARDHSARYVVGTFSSTGQFDDGTIALCSDRACRSDQMHHNAHYVRVPDGMFLIDSPISFWRTMDVGIATGGIAGPVHKAWFMDLLHQGDKVLFAPNCNKHGKCEIWLPDPDKAGREIFCLGYFVPDVAKTNTQTLCGKGKLKPEVEAEVCRVETATK